MLRRVIGHMPRTNPQWTAARRLGVHQRLLGVLNTLLIVLVALTFITGIVASLLGVTEFAPHRLSSAALLIGVGLHLGLHRRALKAQWRRWRPDLQGARPLGLSRITALPRRSPSRERRQPPAA